MARGERRVVTNYQAPDQEEPTTHVVEVMESIDDRRLQDAFVQYYLGEAGGHPIIAARMAGSVSPVSDAVRLMAHKRVQSEIERLRTQLADANNHGVATAVEYAQFLTRVMRGDPHTDSGMYGDPKAPKTADRLKAGAALAELRGWVGNKSDGDKNGVPALKSAGFEMKELIDMERRLINGRRNGEE